MTVVLVVLAVAAVQAMKLLTRPYIRPNLRHVSSELPFVGKLTRLGTLVMDATTSTSAVRAISRVMKNNCLIDDFCFSQDVRRIGK